MVVFESNDVGECAMIVQMKSSRPWPWCLQADGGIWFRLSAARHGSRLCHVFAPSMPWYIEIGRLTDICLFEVLYDWEMEFVSLGVF